MRVARHSLFPTTADLAHAVLPTLGLEMEHNIQKLVPRQGAVVAPINATGSVPIKSFDLNKAWPGYFNYTEWPTVADGNDMVEGSCPASVMSDECQEDLRAVIRARPGIANNNGEPLFHTPNVLENVTSCQGYTTATARRIPLDENYVPPAQWMYSFSGRELEAYNDYGARTFPVMLIWSNAADLDDQGLPTFDDEHVAFACVKADTAVGRGSVLPTGERQDDDEGDDAGGNEANVASGALPRLGVLEWLVALVLGVLFFC